MPHLFEGSGDETLSPAGRARERVRSFEDSSERKTHPEGSCPSRIQLLPVSISEMTGKVSFRQGAGNSEAAISILPLLTGMGLTNCNINELMAMLGKHRCSAGHFPAAAIDADGSLSGKTA